MEKNLKMAILADVPDDWLGQRARRTPLRSSLVEFHLVDGPHGPFNVLHAHETFVKRQVVAHCVLTTNQTAPNEQTVRPSTLLKSFISLPRTLHQRASFASQNGINLNCKSI